MRVTIVGTSYVGLTLATGFAELGHTVVCVERDPETLALLRAHRTLVAEPSIDDLLLKHLGNGLSVTDNLHDAVAEGEVVFVAHEFPYEAGRLVLDALKDLAAEIGNAIRITERYSVVVLKSTVPPGTTEKVFRPILEQCSGKKSGVDFGVAFEPEFLRQNRALGDFFEPDRVVIGTDDDRTRATLLTLAPATPDTPVFVTNPSTAEIVKYTTNAFFALLLSYANEIGKICARTDQVDAEEVFACLEADRRVSPQLPGGGRVKPGLAAYLRPGCGFGGRRFPNDVRSFVGFAEDNGCRAGLLDEVLAINARQPLEMLKLLRKEWPDFRNLAVTVIGVALKPGATDIDESPALPAIDSLLQEQAHVTVFDPGARAEILAHFSEQARLNVEDDFASAVASAEAIMVFTAYPECSTLPTILGKRRDEVAIIDGRRAVDGSNCRRYHALGVWNRRNGTCHA